MAESFADGYDRRAPLYTEFGPKVEDLLRTLLSNDSISVLAVHSRVKSKGSAIGKAGRSTPTLGTIDELHDFLGLRVITYFSDDVDRVARLIEAEFEVDPIGTKDKRAAMDPDRFGYLSVHYRARLNAARRALGEWSAYSEMWFEIQIRSVLQHAWAEVEHDLGYKATTGSVPAEFRRRFSRIAGMLEVADELFLDLRDGLSEYERSVQERGQAGGDEDVNQVTLATFIESNPVVRSADEAIARGHGSELEPLNRTAARLRAEEMVSHGLRTTGAIERALSQSLETVIKVAVAWLNIVDDEEARADEEEARGPDGHYLFLPRGISLYYLSRHLDASASPPDDPESAWYFDDDFRRFHNGIA